MSTEDSSNTIPIRGPALVWKLSQGFLLITELVKTGGADQTVVCEHFAYPNIPIQGTHYHPSYRQRWIERDGIERQFDKLRLVGVDKQFARSVLLFITRIGDGSVTVDSTGRIKPPLDEQAVRDGIVTVHTEDVPPQTPPLVYRGQYAARAIYSLIDDVDVWLERLSIFEKSASLPGELGTLARGARDVRRAAKVEVHALIHANSAVRANVLEVIDSQVPKDSIGLRRWLTDAGDVLREAAEEVARRVTKPTKPTLSQEVEFAGVEVTRQDHKQEAPRGGDGNPASGDPAPRTAVGGDDGRAACDVAIICALHRPELQYVLRAGGHEWSRISTIPTDPTSYHSTRIITSQGKSIRVVAASPTQMGMPASAILATKMILRFSPRLVAMVGIAAGAKSNKQGHGDILAPNQTFDYGSGKLARKGDKLHFAPDANPLALRPRLQDRLLEWSRERRHLDAIRATWGTRAPKTTLSIHVGPLGSGASVVDAKGPVQQVVEHWRKLVGIEMEAYGVHLACEHATAPAPAFLCLKSICDFASGKTDDWQEYAAFTAAELFARFLVEEWDDLHL